MSKSVFEDVDLNVMYKSFVLCSVSEEVSEVLFDINIKLALY
jgi:hypothetical protein